MKGSKVETLEAAIEKEYAELLKEDQYFQKLFLIYRPLHLHNFFHLLILVGFNKFKMQDQRIVKAAVAINITKVLLVIYLGFEEVFRIVKSLQNY